MSKHFIIDFETLGQNTITCPILDSASYVFEWDRFSSVMEPYTFEELVSEIFQQKVSVEDQVKNYGFKIEKSTVEWWSGQEAKAREVLKATPQDSSLKDYIDDLFEYIDRAKKISFWWSRSNTFDPVILWRLSQAVNRESEFQNMLKFWLVRDTRTFIDAKFNFSAKNGFCPFTDEAKWNTIFEEHNSKHDLAADILRLQTIIRAEKGLDIINR